MALTEITQGFLKQVIYIHMKKREIQECFAT